MEYALTADHHRVHAFDAEKGQEYYCPVCGNQVIPRQGEVNSWHFAHVTSCMVAAQQGRGDMILNGTEDGNRVFPKMFVRLSWNTGANAIVQTS